MASTNLTAQDPVNQTAQTTPTDLVLLIFIHGFKGTDSTFGEFPQRLEHILTETLADTKVESITFPAYETKGELNAAVVRFADWLTDLTVRREVANGGAGRAKIVLCGHSMGGLLAADSLIEFVNTRPDQAAPLWPNIVACIAYDTPYLGLHPHVFKNSATQAADYVQQATNVLNSFKTWRARATSSAAATATSVPETAPPVPPKAPMTAPPAEASTATSLWQKWAVPAAVTVGGALFAGAAGTAAYYKRDDIGVGFTWVTDHLKYVGNLWNQDVLEERLNRLLLIESRLGVLFHTFFTYLPPNPPSFPNARTFAVLPHQNSPIATHFGPNRNTLAADEIQAHTGIFDGKTNDGYYDLGLVTAQLIRSAVYRHREVETSAQQAPVPPRKKAEEVKTAVHTSTTAQQAEQVGPSSTAPATEATVAAARVASSVPVAPIQPPSSEKAAPSSTMEEGESSEEEDDDEEEEEEEKGDATKAAVQKDVKAGKEESSEDEDEDDDDDDEEDEEEDDEDEEEEDDDEEDDDDEDEEEEAKAAPAKKAS